MQVTKLERAKQFLPFDALNGFREELYKREKEINKIEKIELCDESLNNLEKEFNRVSIGSVIELIYFEKGNYSSLNGCVTKIDYNRRNIIIENNKNPGEEKEIFLDDIFQIKIK